MKKVTNKINILNQLFQKKIWIVRCSLALALLFDPKYSFKTSPYVLPYALITCQNRRQSFLSNEVLCSSTKRLNSTFPVVL